MTGHGPRTWTVGVVAAVTFSVLALLLLIASVAQLVTGL